MTCNIAGLASGLTVTATVTVSLEETGTLGSTLSVSSPATDPDAANNADRVQTTVTAAGGALSVGAIIAIVVGVGAMAAGALVYLRREKLLPGS